MMKRTMPSQQTIYSEDKAEAAATAHEPAELAITGMTCGNCARHVAEALQSVPGVRNATVSLDSQQARVIWKADAQRDVDKLIHSVEKAGYGAKVISADTQEKTSDQPLAGWRLNLW